MESEKINQYGDELYQALLTREQIPPLSERDSALTIEDAYQISLRVLDLRLSNGEQVIGKKIGITSKVVQDMLGVNQPDFGYLTNTMVYNSGDKISISEGLIQPKAEGEIAFILGDDLDGPGITCADVLRATKSVMPCFEIVDSRIKDWQIKIEDTIADNASSGVFVMGDKAVSPHGLDLTTCGMVVEKNGELVATGAGAAALGNPVSCVAWLANTMGQFGMSLKAGEVILSGALVPLIPVEPGDYMQLSIGGIGSVSVSFA